MRACPYACPGYTPAPEPDRQEQEVHILGADRHVGRTCPAAVVFEDPLVNELLEDHQALTSWCHGNQLDWWNAQPAWWTDGIRIIEHMQDTIKAEALKKE